MAFIIKALGVGNVVATTTTGLYTVSAGKSAIVTSVRLTNNSSANSAQVNLLVRPSGAGTSVQLAKKNDPLAVDAAIVMEDELTLGQGDILQVLVSGTAPSIHYLVNGVEKS